jgi:hypothetical protein
MNYWVLISIAIFIIIVIYIFFTVSDKYKTSQAKKILNKHEIDTKINDKNDTENNAQSEEQNNPQSEEQNNPQSEEQNNVQLEEQNNAQLDVKNKKQLDIQDKAQLDAQNKAQLDAPQLDEQNKSYLKHVKLQEKNNTLKELFSTMNHKEAINKYTKENKSSFSYELKLNSLDRTTFPITYFLPLNYSNTVSTPFCLTLKLGYLPRQHHSLSELNTVQYHGFKLVEPVEFSNMNEMKVRYETNVLKNPIIFDTFTSAICYTTADLLRITSINNKIRNNILPYSKNTSNVTLKFDKGTDGMISEYFSSITISQRLQNKSRIFFEGYEPNPSFSNFYAKGDFKATNPHSNFISAMYDTIDVTDMIKNIVHQYWVGKLLNPYLTLNSLLPLTGTTLILSFNDRTISLVNTERLYIPSVFVQYSFSELKMQCFPRVYGLCKIRDKTDTLLTFFWASITNVDFIKEDIPLYKTYMIMYYIIGPEYKWKSELKACCDEDYYIEAIDNGLAIPVRYLPAPFDINLLNLSEDFIQINDEGNHSVFDSINEFMGNIKIYGYKNGVVLYRDYNGDGTYEIFSNIIPVDMSNASSYTLWTPFYESNETQTVFSDANVILLSETDMDTLFNNVRAYVKEQSGTTIPETFISTAMETIQFNARFKDVGTSSMSFDICAFLAVAVNDGFITPILNPIQGFLHRIIPGVPKESARINFSCKVFIKDWSNKVLHPCPCASVPMWTDVGFGGSGNTPGWWVTAKRDTSQYPFPWDNRSSGYGGGGNILQSVGCPNGLYDVERWKDAVLNCDYSQLARNTTGLQGCCECKWWKAWCCVPVCCPGGWYFSYFSCRTDCPAPYANGQPVPGLLDPGQCYDGRRTNTPPSSSLAWWDIIIPGFDVLSRWKCDPGYTDIGLFCLQTNCGANYTDWGLICVAS